MARIHIDIPEVFLFTTEIPVRVGDLNYGGHVGNDTILSILQEARVQFYRSIGFESELSFEGTVGQIIADAAIQYKSQSFLGDVLVVKLGVTDFNKYGFDMVYVVYNKATDKEVTRGKTGIVCFDYQLNKVARLPESLRLKLNG